MLPPSLEIIEHGFHAYAHRFKKIAPLMLVAFVLSVVSGILIIDLKASIMTGAFAQGTSWQQSFLILTTALIILADAFCNYAIMLALWQTIAEQKTEPLRALLAHTARVFIPALVTGLLVGMAAILGFMILIIPGIIIIGLFFFAMPYALVDGTGIFESIQRSWALTKDRLGAVLWRICVPLAMLFVLHWAMMTIVDLFLPSLLSGAILTGTGVVISGFLGTVLSPWIAAVQLVLFFRLKHEPGV